MLDQEHGTDIALVISVIAIVTLCCSATLISSFCYHRRTRPREDSGESLV